MTTSALFIHPPKTAGTSIRQALGGNNFRDYSARTFDVNAAATIVSFSHATPKGILAGGKVTREQIADWYSFATIRNPWARLVSGYFGAVQSPREANRRLYTGPRATFAGFAEWVVHAQDIPSPDRGKMKQGEWAHPQANWFRLGDRCVIDTFVRVEHIQQDWDVVCRRLGIRADRIGIHGASSHEEYRTYYSQPLQQLVGDFYSQDIELGGYSF